VKQLRLPSAWAVLQLMMESDVDGLIGAGSNLSLLMRQLIGAGTPREAVAGGYGRFCLLITPAGAVLIAQYSLHRTQQGDTYFAAVWFAKG